MFGWITRGSYKKTVVSLSAIAVSLAFLSPASAKTFEVSAGKPTVLFAIGRYDQSNCSSGRQPKYTLKQPEHGKLSVVSHAVKLEKGPCKGKTIKPLWVIYHPSGGYKGRATGSISYTDYYYGDGSGVPRSRNETIILNIK
ncbi:MAG: hypothetical protein KDJ67_13480 [Nitratireductor sp.]|nr:hypothetical protein [Nitratireductor sp.]